MLLRCDDMSTSTESPTFRRIVLPLPSELSSPRGGCLIVKMRAIRSFETSGIYVCTTRHCVTSQKTWMLNNAALRAPNFALLLFSSWTKFWYSTVLTKYLNFATVSKYFTAVSGLWFSSAFFPERTDLNSVKSYALMDLRSFRFGFHIHSLKKGVELKWPYDLKRVTEVIHSAW